MKITTSERIKSCKMKNQGSWKHYQCRMKIIPLKSTIKNEWINFFESTNKDEWRKLESAKVLKRPNEIIKKVKALKNLEWKIKIRESTIRNEWKVKVMKQKLKLHEAITEVISKVGNITPKQMCWILNNSKLYEKRDSSEIKVEQIYARINKYPNLLYIDKNKLIKVK